MKKIAIYGKGGIGKSTVAANLSAALAQSGQRVLQIGCDPKHDSTRLLLNGRVVTTVLDYMRRTPPAEQRLGDLLHEGTGGVVCAEAGGPEPGVGCAGRGILSAFALFDRLGLKTDEYDVILYDVLGDVVCGGFAVPLRKGFADMVYVVTSEEFMATYAANNILRGVQNFDTDAYRLAGLILNSRGRDEDPAPVHRFSKAAGLPIVCSIPRSERFRKAEQRNQTVVEAFPDSPESDLFRDLARRIQDNPSLLPANPLSDEELERTVLFSSPRSLNGTGVENSQAPDSKDMGWKAGLGSARSNENSSSVKGRPDVEISDSENQLSSSGSTSMLSKSMLFREPLHGCALTGAVTTTVQIRNAITVIHGPRSCAHISTRTVLASGIRARTRKGLLLPRQLAPSVMSSDMDESVMIHGGGDNLRATLKKAMARQPEAVFMVTTCPSGVIGDDTESAVRDVTSQYPEIPVFPVTTDGNIRGDYMQGVINACLEGAAAMIDRSVEPEKDRVNILAEKNIANNAEHNFAVVSELLRSMDIGINCRFVRDVSVEELRGFQKARLNLLAYEDQFGRVLRSFFTEQRGAAFASYPFPVGFAETKRWLEDIGAFFGKADVAKQIAEAHRGRYDAAIRQFLPLLSGKRLMIVSYVHDVDWIVEVAFDLGMVVEKVGILDYSQDHIFRTRFKDRFELELNYTPEKRDADLLRFRPDLMLCNYVPKHLPVALHADGIPLCPDVGLYGGLPLARRWAALLKSPVREGWRDDGFSIA